MLTIEVVSPQASAAQSIVRSYMTDIASRYYGRPATPDEVDQALRDEPCHDLDGTTGMLLVAMDDDDPIACAGVRFTDEIAELTKVFTRADARGKGLGGRLLAEIEDACRDRGIRTIRLDTRSDLVEAHALYERHGFVRVEAFNADAYADRWYAKDIG